MRRLLCFISLWTALLGRADAVTVIESGHAKFIVGSNGYVAAWWLDHSLDAPGAAESADSVVVNGSKLGDFTIETNGISRAAVSGGLGGSGTRVVIPARSSQIERVTTLELYENFPGLLISVVSYRNGGRNAVKLDEAITQRHRLSAASDLWSFQGASRKWGEDDVVRLSPGFARENDFGQTLPSGNGGGVPVVAFWQRRAGLAIGHLDTLPLTLSMPVSMGRDGTATAEIRLRPGVTLAPGESWSTPPTFTMVFSGDYYEALRTYSLALQRRGWNLPQPSAEAWNVSWCGWGYLADVTSREMLGILPKLKEYQIKWATLDDRWFQTYGDWNPRPDTFPGRTIQNMVREYHRNGIHVQLWWIPLAAEIRGGHDEDHAYVDSEVVREHPDWLILDRNGKPAVTARGLVTLCPALPEVRDYHRKLVRRFIHDWDFDGHKMDNIFSVPPCYNSRHHHKSPQDSVQALGSLYKAIYETTRALKPESVTQICPCGTPPNIAWLPYMDQSVTADPVGSAQVRRRIKMYKALLGPRAPVYGDHVELTAIKYEGEKEWDLGRDFASTVGTGGVVGTKFVWPQTDPKLADAVLTPDKAAIWRKWIGIYNAKMLSRGEFLNLYVLGFDKPEGYAIAKGGKMYYAFYTDEPDGSWSGAIELRGLKPGRYSVTDYVDNRVMGIVDAANPRLTARFKGSLLLEAATSR